MCSAVFCLCFVAALLFYGFRAETSSGRLQTIWGLTILIRMMMMIIMIIMIVTTVTIVIIIVVIIMASYAFAETVLLYYK